LVEKHSRRRGRALRQLADDNDAKPGASIDAEADEELAKALGNRREPTAGPGKAETSGSIDSQLTKESQPLNSFRQLSTWL